MTHSEFEIDTNKKALCEYPESAFFSINYETKTLYALTSLTPARPHASL